MTGYAKGGHVSGPREPGDDTVPVMMDHVRILTQETRGGEEPFDWRVNPDAIREAEKQGDDQ